MMLARRLRDGGRLLGMQSFSGSAPMLHVLGRAGFDFAMIDLEHTAIEMEDAENLVRAAAAEGVPSLVRVRSNEPALIAQALSGIAEGVIVPRINSAEEARAAVRAARLPPHGDRRLPAGIRPGTEAGAWSAQLQALDERLLVVALVEDVRGVDAIESIVAVEGLDAILFGPADFGMSIGAAQAGFGGDVQRRTFEALDHVVAAARKRNMPVMTTPILNVLDVENALTDLFARGVDVILYSIDTMMTRAAMGSLRDAFVASAQRG
jgi:4-hydroxy-2-oxoheptanedioate aldolase